MRSSLIMALMAFGALSGLQACTTDTTETAAPRSTAAMTQFSATLDGAQEVPPKTVAGRGSATATLDRATRSFTYEVDYSGLTGPLTAAHFHGPAAKGANAGPVLPITAGPSPLKGSATLTETQVEHLMAGHWYINLHTQANPGGEIRGQVMPR